MNVSPKCTACRICWFERVHTSPRDCAYHSSWPTPRQVTASAPSHKVITPCVAVSVIASHEAAPRTFSSASASVVYLLPKDHNYWCVRACVLYFCTADLLQTLPWAWCIFFFFFFLLGGRVCNSCDICFSSGYKLIMLLFQWHYLYCWLMCTKAMWNFGHAVVDLKRLNMHWCATSWLQDLQEGRHACLCTCAEG